MNELQMSVDVRFFRRKSAGIKMTRKLGRKQKSHHSFSRGAALSQFADMLLQPLKRR